VETVFTLAYGHVFCQQEFSGREVFRCKRKV
jgi:hypothetical protein